MVKNTYHNPQTYVSRVSIDHSFVLSTQTVNSDNDIEKMIAEAKALEPKMTY